MLIKYSRIGSLDFESIIRVYSQSLGSLNWKKESRFIEDLQMFFDNDRVYLATWSVGSEMVCAMRVEPYKDGYLISCLETVPHCRRMGYAASLMRAVMEESPGIYYSHVDKNNLPSVLLHKKMGFSIISDYAVYVDGSVLSSSYTLRR